MPETIGLVVACRKAIRRPPFEAAGGFGAKGVAVSNPERRELLISKGWVQGAILVTLVGFFIMGLLAYRTYTEQPPVPKRVVDQQGQVVYTGKDVSKGSRCSCTTA